MKVTGKRRVAFAGAAPTLAPMAVVRRILAPVELSDSRDPDLSYPIGLAAQMGAELVLFAVIDTPATVNLIGRAKTRAAGSAVQHRSDDFNAAIVRDAEAILQQLVDDAAELGVEALGHVTMSENVEEEILKEALVRKVDLIVVRSRGQGTLTKALFGSTAGEILKAAPCPVLVATAS